MCSWLEVSGLNFRATPVSMARLSALHIYNGISSSFLSGCKGLFSESTRNWDTTLKCLCGSQYHDFCFLHQAGELFICKLSPFVPTGSFHREAELSFRGHASFLCRKIETAARNFNQCFQIPKL